MVSLGQHKISRQLWQTMWFRNSHFRYRIETRALLAKIRALGLTQKQVADLMGGPAAYYRFCQIARGHQLPDFWEMGRLREIVAEQEESRGGRLER